MTCTSLSITRSDGRGQSDDDRPGAEQQRRTNPCAEERLEHGVRIEVHDASERKPELQRASADEQSGRGLALVDALTDGQWGVSARQGPGKLVWAVCADHTMAEASR
jgi:hypothetical protein